MVGGKEGVIKSKGGKAGDEGNVGSEEPWSQRLGDSVLFECSHLHACAH